MSTEGKTIYSISPSISLLQVKDVPENVDDPFFMVKDGSVISTLNYTAGLLLLLVSKKGKPIEEIYIEVERMFEDSDEIRADIDKMFESFIERKWVFKCQK